MTKSELKQLVSEVVNEMATGKRPMNMDALYRVLDRATGDWNNGDVYVMVNGEVVPVTGVSLQKPKLNLTGDETDDAIVEKARVKIILKT